MGNPEIEAKPQAGVLTTPCWELKHKMWMLRHKKSAYGYSRHDKFVMYCDRTSNSFLAKTDVLKTLLKGWNATMGSMAHTDFFLRIQKHNDKQIAASTWENKLKAPTRVANTILVGTCSEFILSVQPRTYVVRGQSTQLKYSAVAESHNYNFCRVPPSRGCVRYRWHSIGRDLREERRNSRAFDERPLFAFMPPYPATKGLYLLSRAVEQPQMGTSREGREERVHVRHQPAPRKPLRCDATRRRVTLGNGR